MKKPYAKPLFLFESFSLSTNIAGDCEIYTNTYSRGTCAYHTKRGNVFISSIDQCKVKEGQDPGINIGSDGSASYYDICYHVPIETNNLFNS